MTKPKAQTLQQKMGFFDEDLRKPKHDDIMLWLDKNIEEIINNLFNKPFTESEINSMKVMVSNRIKSVLDHFDKDIKSIENELNNYDTENKIKFSFISSKSKEELVKKIEELKIRKEILEKFETEDPNIYIKPRIKTIAKKWELPVSTANSTNKFTIGFIDFCATFNMPQFELLGLRYNILAKHPYTITYYDFYEKELKFTYTPHEKIIYVEVKSEITSLGELIRQINHYKTYLSGDYYVLCPDNKYKDTLQEQGIKTINFVS